MQTSDDQIKKTKCPQLAHYLFDMRSHRKINMAELMVTMSALRLVLVWRRCRREKEVRRNHTEWVRS